jgi:hypothetical protein
MKDEEGTKEHSGWIAILSSLTLLPLSLYSIMLNIESAPDRAPTGAL